MIQDPTTAPADATAAPATPDPAMPAMDPTMDAGATADPAMAGDAAAAVDPTAVGTMASTKADNAAAMSQMGFAHMIQNFDFVGWTVFITLIVMSIVSWYFIVINAIRNSMIGARAENVIRSFWGAGNLQGSIDAMKKNEPLSKIAIDCVDAVAHHQKSEGSSLVGALSRSEFIDRALRQAVTRENSRLETGLTWLASTGSTAPFVGLLGTVWGIYHALLRIAASGQASMDAVAGPVGEALIMTAFGLFVAIPAVLAYNFLTRGNRKISGMFEEFAHDLHDYFATGGRVDGAGPAKPKK
jgi:biopolymer transport protein ExbB